ncbi:hypothetical protein AKJ66_02525 [candidate division MSBL1 archaeon SCGC-AAA259E22]|uniref:ArnR1-like winged helix-turn-helix domain-containing protein n=1 Tax=candidate division MSBL1 archaeon SCGC-AAA259E22 TaxID=1698265 RepID=A0A133UG76_9EURY|nr:hypothetical protein AKJ66_02525 [candidate division MSBL1 archaeon SCGC-AAA259E22]
MLFSQLFDLTLLFCLKHNRIVVILMNNLLVSGKKKIEILQVLKDGKVHSFYNLSKEVGTNFNTSKKNCNFLELLKLINIDKTTAEESASGKPRYRIKINKEGREFLESINL